MQDFPLPLSQLFAPVCFVTARILLFFERLLRNSFTRSSNSHAIMRFSKSRNWSEEVVSIMADQLRTGTKFVIGPDGSPLSIADLPPANTRRWVTRRKAEVVAAVRGGLISLDEACERYRLSVEEFLSWQRTLTKHGVKGLRTTRLQDIRSRS
jgi:hypothetical protein